jgi:hypothetical protein
MFAESPIHEPKWSPDDVGSMGVRGMSSELFGTRDLRTAAAMVEASYPGLELARNLPFNELWEFFIATKFLYPEKLARLAPFMDEIKRTMNALLAANGDLLVTSILRDPHTALCGQVCALRTYQRTWSFQHLAGRLLPAQRLDTAARVTLALIYYAELRTEIEWFKMFFRPNNPWPSRVFGGFATLLSCPLTSQLRRFHYLTAGSGQCRPAPALRVRPAGSDELHFIGQWFASRDRNTDVMANDLEPPETELSTIGERFAAFGLTRRREVLVAERAGRITGFALLEVSSLGMNFSELTNAFTVHLVEDDDNESRLALALYARRRYEDLGRTVCIALDDGQDLSAFEAAGFLEAKEYMCWTFNRQHLPQFEEYLVGLFSDRRVGVA